MNVSQPSHKIWEARQAFQAGRLEAAHALAVEMLRGDPRSVEALEIKALVEIHRGKDEAAEQTLRMAMSVAPAERWPYSGLTELLMRHGRLAESEAVCRSAIATDPRDAEAHERLGSLLSMRMKAHDAVEHFQQAVAYAGPQPHLLTRLGHVLLRLGRLDEARDPLETAAANSNAFEATVYLAELEERLGNFEAAMRQLDRADQMDRPPGNSLDRHRSVLLSRMGDHEQALAILETSTNLSGAAQLQRGRLRERAGRHAEAWNDWIEAKERLARMSNRQYPKDAIQTLANRLADFFASPAAKSLPRAARREGVPQPIFIVGFPRSGTTLTERILASHSQIVAGGELPFGSDLQILAGEAAGGEWSFPGGLVRAGADWTARMRDRYLAGAKQFGLLDGGQRFFTDKMPTNDFWLPLLRLAFPESPVVHVRRHPLDILTSVMAHEMTHGFNSAYRLEDSARHLALSDWLLERYDDAGFGPTFSLRYETLIANQNEETERLTSALGLELEPAQLRFHERAEVPATPSYVQVRQPLNDRSIGNWRNHATELASVIPLLADAMRRGAYSV